MRRGTSPAERTTTRFVFKASFMSFLLLVFHADWSNRNSSSVCLVSGCLQVVASGSVSSTSFLSCDLLIRFPPTVFSGLVMVPAPAIAQSLHGRLNHIIHPQELCLPPCQCDIILIYFFPLVFIFFFEARRTKNNDRFQTCVCSVFLSPAWGKAARKWQKWPVAAVHYPFSFYLCGLEENGSFLQTASQTALNYSCAHAERDTGLKVL